MKVHRVSLLVCQACIDGVGQECHTPSCIFCLKRPPENGFPEEMIEITDTFEEP